MRFFEIFDNSNVLFESYKTFSSKWSELISRNKSYAEKQLSSYSTDINDIIENSPSIKLSKISSLSQIPSTLEAILKDNAYRSYINGYKDISEFIGIINNGEESIKEILYLLYNMVSDIAKELSNRTPEYSVVKITEKYKIVNIKNFSAAKKIRNKLGANWCIGAKESDFHSYGQEIKRETYYVIFDDGYSMVVHVQPDFTENNLLTSFDNTKSGYIEDGKYHREKGHNFIDSEISKYLSDDEIVQLFNFFGINYKIEKEFMKRYHDVIKIIKEFDDSVKDTETYHAIILAMKDIKLNEMYDDQEVIYNLSHDFKNIVKFYKHDIQQNSSLEDNLKDLFNIFSDYAILVASNIDTNVENLFKAIRNSL